MKKTLSLLACILLCAGCVSTSFESHDLKFKRSAWFNKTQIGTLVLESTTNGIRKVTLRGYGNDQVEAIEAAARGAASARPVP